MGSLGRENGTSGRFLKIFEKYPVLEGGVHLTPHSRAENGHQGPNRKWGVPGKVIGSQSVDQKEGTRFGPFLTLFCENGVN